MAIRPSMRALASPRPGISEKVVYYAKRLWVRTSWGPDSRVRPACEANARQRRPQIVGDIVQGLAHADDERLIFVEHAVEELGEVVEFIIGMADGNAGVELTGINDGTGSGDDFADWLHGTMGEEGAADEAEQDDGRHYREKGAAKRPEDRVAVA